jgi:hypothetical protein
VCRYCGFDFARPTRPPTQVAAKTNGLAIASGILWLMGIGSLLAVIFGQLALNQIKLADPAQGGRGMAIAGLVLDCIGLGVLLVTLNRPPRYRRPLPGIQSWHGFSWLRGWDSNPRQTD